MSRRWELVRNELATDIQAGRLQPGDRLPPDNALAARYGVNRLTVRHAIQVMAVDGLLRVQHGVGTFVSDVVLDYKLGRVVRLTQNLLDQDRLVRRVLLEKEAMKCPREVSRHLGVREGVPVAYVRFLGLVDERPQLVSDNWFSLARVPNILDSFTGLNSITRALKRCGIDHYQRQWSRLSARAATDAEAISLRLPPRAPVFIQKALDIDPQGMPIKFGESVWRADRTEFVVEGQNV